MRRKVSCKANLIRKVSEFEIISPHISQVTTAASRKIVVDWCLTLELKILVFINNSGKNNFFRVRVTAAFLEVIRKLLQWIPSSAKEALRHNLEQRIDSVPYSMRQAKNVYNNISVFRDHCNLQSTFPYRLIVHSSSIGWKFPVLLWALFIYLLTK